MDIRLMEPEQLKAFLAKIPELSIDKKMELYLRLRKAKSVCKKHMDAVDDQYKECMSTIENHMLADADKAKVTGFTITGLGTSYTAETKKISVADDAVFDAFVLQAQDLSFFERRVSSKRVDAYIKETKVNPPGLNIFRERVMRVRKAGEQIAED
jgi:hypothetical protein